MAAVGNAGVVVVAVLAAVLAAAVVAAETYFAFVGQRSLHQIDVNGYRSGYDQGGYESYPACHRL